jgi:hypothetical protein
MIFVHICAVDKASLNNRLVFGCKNVGVLCRV